MSVFSTEVGALVSLQLRGALPKARPSTRAAWLRGALAARFHDDAAFHGHGPKGTQLRYPPVQYRWLNAPQVLVIGAPLDRLAREPLVGSSLTLDGRSTVVDDLRWEPVEFSLAPSDHLIRYRFATPWLALNQENHARYTQLDEGAKRAELDRILRGNLLTMFTGFGWRLDASERVFAAFEPAGTVSTNLKDVGLLAFEGTFVTNWSLPKAIAIGRSVSHGFGVIAPR